MSESGLTYPGTIEEAPHRVGGGYLFRRGELLVGQDSVEALGAVLTSGAFRRRITRRVITREILGSDLHPDDVGLPEDLPTGSGADDRAHSSGAAHRDIGSRRPATAALPEPIRRAFRALAFLVRSGGILRLSTTTVRVDEATGLHVLRLQGAAGARLAIPLIVDALKEIEPSDQLRPLDVAPNHVAYPATHTRGGSVVPPQWADEPAEPSGSAGAGIVVAVLDNGVDDTHPWLKPRVQYLPAGSAASDGPWPSSLPPFVDGAELPAYAGHGTFIAGQVVQLAPAATIVPVRVLDESGFGDDTSLARRIGELPTTGSLRPDVIVMALGGHVHAGLVFSATQAALRTHLRANPHCAVVAAAGNENSSDPTYPAAFRTVTGVAALDGQSTTACFSNHNAPSRADWVDAGTGGVAEVSAFINTAGARVRPQPRNPGSPDDPPPPARCPRVPFDQKTAFDGFAKLSGTSMSAGRLAGLVAANAKPGHADEALRQLLLAGAPRPEVGVVV